MSRSNSPVRLFQTRMIHQLPTKTVLGILNIKIDHITYHWHVVHCNKHKPVKKKKDTLSSYIQSRSCLSKTGKGHNRIVLNNVCDSSKCHSQIALNKCQA